MPFAITQAQLSNQAVRAEHGLKHVDTKLHRQKQSRQHALRLNITHLHTDTLTLRNNRTCNIRRQVELRSRANHAFSNTGALQGTLPHTPDTKYCSSRA